MKKIKVCLLEKKRGNFVLQEKFTGKENFVDTTKKEIEHHFKALRTAGYEVIKLKWSPNIISDLNDLDIDIVFNVSSIAEAAILDELKIPYVGSDIFGIIKATDKALAKEIWISNRLPTSPFIIAKSINDCNIFRKSPPFSYPLFIKPSAGRGSSGIDKSSIIFSYKTLVKRVKERIEKIGQPVLIEKFIKGKEITCGIIGNGQYIRTLPLLEIDYKNGDKFLTFDKKELDNDRFYCPAKLSPHRSKHLQYLAIKAYKSVGLRDFGRVDMILSEDGPLLLEINCFAGLMCTPIKKPHSYMGFMAVAEGKSSTEFLDEIIKVALKRNKMAF
ncbi:MAG: ATP-grasp domain-containing protein [Promethearchaeota archaeon]|nr:MAG: ATP-grasp domain-containing protein [Candidatus Lokiarchaeota archaeon]